MSCYLMHLERITYSQAMRKPRFVYHLIVWEKYTITSWRLFYKFLQKQTKYEKLEKFCGWHVKLTKL